MRKGYTDRARQRLSEIRKNHFELVTLVTAIAGVVVVAASTAITAWSAVLMQSQLQVMRSQQRSMESQQRPWIQVTDLTVSSAMGPRMPYPAVASFDVKNIGPSPATDVIVSIRILDVETRLEKAADEAVEIEQRAACTNAKEARGRSVLPEETTPSVKRFLGKTC